MSWRETLGVIPSTKTPYTHNSHNSHNAQKPTKPGNCADIADSAYRDSEAEIIGQPEPRTTPKDAALLDRIHGKQRLLLATENLGADPADLLDWYRDDLADFASMPSAQLVAIVKDYLSHRSEYRSRRG